MLKGKDPKTGKTLSDENIKNNVSFALSSPRAYT